MKIKHIKIKDFRSIKNDSFSTTDFSILVGKNNHGKSNIFEAIDWFFNDLGRGDNYEDICRNKNTNNTPSITITFTGAQDALEQMKNKKKRKTIKNKIEDSDTIKIKRKGKDKRVFVIDGEEVDPGTGMKKALNDFLPKTEYIDARKDIDDVTKTRKKDPISKMLLDVITDQIENENKYSEFKDSFENLFQGEESEIREEIDDFSKKIENNLEKQFPGKPDIRFEIEEPDIRKMLKNFETYIEDNVETRLEEKGEGMQRAVMLSIIQVFAKFRKNNSKAGKNFIFLIDEAEMHLHPSAQRMLENALSDLSKEEDQVFISTHSSVFISSKESSKTILEVEKSDSITSINECHSPTKKHSIIYDLLGGSPADILLPNNFLIVEGLSEYKLLTKIINRFYPEKTSIQIIFASGDALQQKRSMYAIHEAYKTLHTTPVYKDKVVVLCDQPNDSDRERHLEDFKDSYPEIENNNRLFILPTEGVESYYPNDWNLTEEEIDNLDSKVDYANEVAENITKDEFENDMEECFEALKRTWELAHN